MAIDYATATTSYVKLPPVSSMGRRWVRWAWWRARTEGGARQPTGGLHGVDGAEHSGSVVPVRATEVRAGLRHGNMLDDQQTAAGTHYRRNRYYDPGAGRFTQEDPIGLAGGLNLYGFAGSNPANFGDPFGLKVCFLGKEVSRLAKATMVGTGTIFDLDVSGCATNVQAVGGNWSEVSSGFAELAAVTGFCPSPVREGAAGR